MQPVAELPNKIRQLGTSAAQFMSVGTVGNIPVVVTVGTLEKTPVDAVVAPQWPGNAGSYGGGVGAALIGAGGQKAYEDYAAHCKKTTTKFGDTHVSRSGVALWPKVINAVTVGSGKDHEFKVIEDATYNILKTAVANRIRTVGFAALGTGAIGDLTPLQSARAMTNGIARASREGLDVEVAIVVWTGERDALGAFKAFSGTVTAGISGFEPEVGRKNFDQDRVV
jgi:O-acetyl-ADP-ribose deacetylase (regulator of RNase III)